MPVMAFTHYMKKVELWGIWLLAHGYMMGL